MAKSSKTGAKPLAAKNAKPSALKSKPIPAKKIVAKPQSKQASKAVSASKPTPKQTVKAAPKPVSKTSAKAVTATKVKPQAKAVSKPLAKVSVESKLKTNSKSSVKLSKSNTTKSSRSATPKAKLATPPLPANRVANSSVPNTSKRAKSSDSAQSSSSTQKKTPSKQVPPTLASKLSKPSNVKDLKAQANPKIAKNPKPAPAPAKTPEKDDSKMVKAVRKGRAAVDVECPKSKDCHVFEEGQKVWTVTLNQADLKNNANKYYIIQLLQSDASSNQYHVWNRWGRVGYSGQNALKGPFSDLARAKADYESKLREKTRNGYIEVQIVYEEENEVKPEKPAKQVKGKPAKEIKSNMDKRVADLVNLIFDLKSINRTLAEIGYDSRKMPLGKLSIATIRQGMEVLKQIESALNSNKKADLETLSSRFYSLIPHDFGFQKMANFIINNNEKLKQKVEMLESLADMKIATNILEASTEGNPHDEHYKKLNCKLSPLEKTDPVFKTLETYVKNTHGNTHSYYTLEVQDIFRVDKDGESARFSTSIKNNMLLWHGSRLTNWVGILSQGLRIAPPEAPVSGYMFGKGVYFADMVSKSANYCFTSKDNNTGLLLLCDVAVGNYNEKLHSDYNANNLPKGKNSTKGCGLCAPPEKSYINLEGCKVPLGPGEKVTLNGGYLQYNEYIVYNTNQIRMKFLLRVKFNYKY